MLTKNRDQLIKKFDGLLKFLQRPEGIDPNRDDLLLDIQFFDLCEILAELQRLEIAEPRDVRDGVAHYAVAVPTADAFRRLIGMFWALERQYQAVETQLSRCRDAAQILKEVLP